MSPSRKIGVIGGDRRQYYMAKQLVDEGIDIMLYAVENGIELVRSNRGGAGIVIAKSLHEFMEAAEIIIGPIPFCRDGNCIFAANRAGAADMSVCAGSLDAFCEGMTKKHIIAGGNIPKKVLQTAAERGAVCFDFMKMDKVAAENAVATAEGTIAEAICESEGNLGQSRCIVLGYGRCAKALSERLNGMKAYVTIVARNADQLEEARNKGYETIPLFEFSNEPKKQHVIKEADYIFNTIPAIVITQEVLEQLKEEAVIIDIASKPGGTDFAACERLGIRAKLSPGIPGRYAPRTSAQILLNSVRHLFFPPFE